MGSKKTKKMTPRRQALLTKGGYLRLSPDLLPQGWGPHTENSFFLLADPANKTIELQPANGTKSEWPKRRAVFSNGSAKSPHVALREVLKLIGVQLPKKSVEYKVEKSLEGKLLVKF